jgi:hypothetical protein
MRKRRFHITHPVKMAGSIIFVLIIAMSCRDELDPRDDMFRMAGEHSELVNESYIRCKDYTMAWLQFRDPASGLIPSNLMSKTDIWEPHNAAADNYAFMVLTAYLLDRELYHGAMHEMLNAERKLTSRIGSLPDTYSFSKQGFQTDSADLNWIIFGSSEYVKDGLLPLTEYIGESPWRDRLIEIMDDLSDHYDEFMSLGELGPYRAARDEVNGEMLQSLSRIYWMTGDRRYLDRAVEIGDYYLLGEGDLSESEYLRLRDHGCEVIGGLSELYVALHYADPVKKEQYQERLYKILDRVLKVGRNEDGLFYNVINASTGEIIHDGVADTWGYIFNAFYSVYLVDGKEEYRQAFLDCIGNLNEKYRNYRWEGDSHDGYADALESGIILFNREPVPELGDWLDSEMKVMWGKQQENGLIEGWHGDGNFARTTIMYALWKTQGVHCHPWRKDVRFGAVRRDDSLYIAISTGKDFRGKLVFDYKRHRELLNLPIDYPRINQYPEWFTADPSAQYRLVSTQKELNGRFSGEELIEGLTIELDAGNRCLILVE